MLPQELFGVELGAVGPAAPGPQIERLDIR